eukprot:5268066-Ditylum_brightwellii.AAC.1
MADQFQCKHFDLKFLLTALGSAPPAPTCESPLSSSATRDPLYLSPVDQGSHHTAGAAEHCTGG